MAHDVGFDFLEKIIGKDKFVESLVGRLIDLVHVTDPLAVAFIDEDDVLTYTEHRVHVVGVDDGGYVVFVGNIAQEFINEDGCAGVKSGVRLVAEEIFRI